MITLEQRKEAVNYLENKVKKLNENERKIFNVGKFLEDFKTKEFVLLGKDMSFHSVSKEIKNINNESELASFSNMEIFNSQPKTLLSTLEQPKTGQTQTIKQFQKIF